MLELCKKIGFDSGTADFFKELYSMYLCNKHIRDDFNSALDNFFCSNTHEYIDILKRIAEKINISEYSVDMLFLLIAVRPMHYIYKKSGINDDVFYETIKDFGYKLNECKKMYGVRGTFVIDWYKYFVDNTIVQLGRLQFERISMPYDYKDTVKKGDTVIACHIPSNGSLELKDALDAFRDAYRFYNCSDKTVFVCQSWMLYPPHYEVFLENSNLRKFYNLFDVINQIETNNSDMWRIFFKSNADKLEDLPQDTRLQKSFVKYLQDGNKMGVGFGVMVFDGNSVINSKTIIEMN